ncbi:MAG: 23S rRNA (pseudouridine(1915)-N(3))-methyltransferase RlmH [Acetobacteraceae bacterium]|nr:23S rRNA (pseudouridine(1915)-N(3))-methyltransferase RlmH [Acetobacteraceae bacterium]MBV8523825.1 23S rRNA (pseudouridine(1915)-N(3))-methyltransferase RlmH [Acetobacteraceae bacterium]MBV8589092.1 23S rRNA (pseudouridine(1915)-N(3))-methyltransferase RlmH [Acetobacteraceae bacterium]
MRLIAVGRLGRGPESELFARYAMRLRPKLSVIEIAQAQGSPAEIKRREAHSLLAAAASSDFIVALDRGGATPGTEEFAALLERWLSRPLCFVIGGAEGLHAEVIARADYVLSLSQLTWPHLLVRIMLAEQLYRARAIALGHPYHRHGRS